MAENESLDLGRAPRWKRVHRSVMDGEPSESVADEARASLCRTVRAIMRLIPFDELLSAACDDPDALPDLIRGCGKGREFANRFLFVAEKGASREDVLHAYLETIYDGFLEQIAANSFPSQRWSNLPEFRRYLAEVRDLLAHEIDRIAHKMAEDPKWRPRVRPRRNGSNSTHELLHESLLGVARK
jgi:hypothetical protein